MTEADGSEVMMPRPNLSRAPIREAVIDFRVRPTAQGIERPMTDLCESLSDKYPEQKPIHQFHGEIRFDDTGLAATEQATRRYGYRLTNTERTSVVQVRPDGFTFSRLRPYESWGAMVTEAWPIWERYVERLAPAHATRVATRFINVLPLTPGEPLSSLLTAPPSVPDGLPSSLTDFVLRYVTEETDSIASIVSLATEGGGGGTSLILDIDCFVRGDFSLTEVGMDALLGLLPKLRERKNEVFFRSIEPRAMEKWK